MVRDAELCQRTDKIFGQVMRAVAPEHVHPSTPAQYLPENSDDAKERAYELCEMVQMCWEQRLLVEVCRVALECDDSGYVWMIDVGLAKSWQYGQLEFDDSIPCTRRRVYITTKETAIYIATSIGMIFQKD